MKDEGRTEVPPLTSTQLCRTRADAGIDIFKSASLRDWLVESNGRCFRYRPLSEPDEDGLSGWFETPRGRCIAYVYLERMEVLTRDL